MPNKKQADSLFLSRPHSGVMGKGEIQYLSTNSKINMSPARSPNLVHKETKKSKRVSSSTNLKNSNSSESLGYASNSSDLDYNSLDTGRQKKNKKKSSTSSQSVGPLAGPSASSWIVPRSIKKLNTNGHVFGAHIAKSGACYVSVVTDKGDRTIQTFDRSGSFVRSFPMQAIKAGKQFEPYQIHETPDGHLAVASGSCVTVWTKEGKLVIEHGRNMFKFAKCCAVRSTGEIAVTDTDNKAVKIISASGQQIYKLEGDFTCPVGIAVDSNDYIIVSDWQDKISIYDSENELVHSFGVKGSNDGEFDLPYGVSVDSQNNIVVADMWNHRLSVFNQQGQFLNNIANAPGQSLRMPAHVSVAKATSPDDYRLVVTDFSANHVRLYSY